MIIRYFFLTVQIEKGNVAVVYCPTDEMIGDFFTEPLQGAKFQKFRGLIMGFKDPKVFRRAKAGDRSVLRERSYG